MKIIKLLSVKGFYQEGDNFGFVEEKSWKGTALLREDLTFEGIVVDNSVNSNFYKSQYQNYQKRENNFYQFRHHKLATRTVNIFHL